MNVGDLVKNDKNMIGLVLRIIPDSTFLFVEVAWCNGEVAVELDHQIGIYDASR